MPQQENKDDTRATCTWFRSTRQLTIQLSLVNMLNGVSLSKNVLRSHHTRGDPQGLTGHMPNETADSQTDETSKLLARQTKFN